MLNCVSLKVLDTFFIRLVTSLVFSTLSIAASIVAATFSGIDASNIQYYSYYYCRYVGSYYYCGQ